MPESTAAIAGQPTFGSDGSQLIAFAQGGNCPPTVNSGSAGMAACAAAVASSASASSVAAALLAPFRTYPAYCPDARRGPVALREGLTGLRRCTTARLPGILRETSVRTYSATAAS